MIQEFKSYSNFRKIIWILFVISVFLLGISLMSFVVNNEVDEIINYISIAGMILAGVLIAIFICILMFSKR